MSLARSIFLSSIAEIKRLDIQSAFTWDKFLNQGVDAYFDARVVGLDGSESSAKASDYWKQVSFKSSDSFLGMLECPSSLSGVVVISKNTFNSAVFRTILPTLSVDGQAVWLGFENGSYAGVGEVDFAYMMVSGASKLYACLGADFNEFLVDITNMLPADANSAGHTYSIRVFDNFAEFYIDRSVVAIGLNCKLPNVINAPPYAIFGVDGMSPFITKINVIAEVDGLGYDLSLPLSPYWTRAGRITTHLSRVYSLYQANSTSLMAGASISSGSITSHPIPVFGYKEWELLIDASQDFTVQLQYLGLSGNWRTFDNYSSPTGSNRIHLLVDEPMILAKAVITPSAYPMTINDAFAVLVR